MRILLKERIQSILKVLKQAGKHRLAKCIEDNWNKTALDYSKELNFWRPKRPIEPELLKAFNKELTRLDTSSLHKNEILHSIKKRRVLQTGPHLGVTETPRMFCVNWLGSLGVPEKEFYIVGMFSGVPFSNKSRPGRINMKSSSINLFPSNLQDGLVYKSTIPKKLVDSLDAIPDQILRTLPKAVEGESYTKWAIQTCEFIERKILKKNNLIFLDINEVVTNYLLKVLNNPEHTFYKIFFDEETRKEFLKTFSGEIMFYRPTIVGKYEKMENVRIYSKYLKSKSIEIPLHKPDHLIKELREGRLCPSILTAFLSLAFFNQFKCFGSFAQVEYLPVYQEKLKALSFMKEYQIDSIQTSNLTTGVFPEKRNLYPADIILDNKNFNQSSGILFGELLYYMKKTLLESYFTGDVRKEDPNEAK